MTELPRITPCDEPIPAWLLKKTFSIQYNPDCSLPWLVRLPGFGRAVLDIGNGNEDLLGFGQTCEQAASYAEACFARAATRLKEHQAAVSLRRAWWRQHAIAMMAE